MIEFALDQRYDQSQFMAFLKTFLPDDYIQQEREVEISFNSNFITQATSLGTCKSVDLEVYVLRHTSLGDARVGLSKDAFRLLLSQSFHNHALVVYLPEQGGQWRLSLLQMEAEVSDRTSRITRSYSNPRRYSFLLGEGAHVKTPHQFLFEKGQIRQRKENNKQLTEWEDLLSRFSVEVLTKEFYEKLYHWYQWAVEESTGVTFPNNTSTSDDDRIEISSNIIRLITRLLFVWFIKQKGLVPEDIFDLHALDNLLIDFKPNDAKDGTYYNAILQNLFFATLNNEIGKRKFVCKRFNGKNPSRGVKTLFRDKSDSEATWYKVPHEDVLRIFHKVPYMNCGLFECLDRYKKTDIGQEEDDFKDGFSSSGARDAKTKHLKYRAFIPNTLFFAPEHSETVTVIDDEETTQVEINVSGIINILREYNFTVEENTPVDMQVSLDPELLGRVFENLLAAYNPETGVSVKKITGSYYTPRYIVEYMVNESLISYLERKIDNGHQYVDEFKKLFDYQDNEVNLPVEIQDACLKALYDCRILDPACGSGAFPMGMLQQMVHVIKRLDPDNEKWRQVVLDKALEESKLALMTESKEARHKRLQEIEDEFDDNMTNPDYKRKLYIIQNCIYGVDIQPIAMLISKLRFFISLVCEQREDSSKTEEDNYGINTLPNLETKFVAANTLIPANIIHYKGKWTDDPELSKKKDELFDIRMRHFKVKTQQSKIENRKKDEAKRQEILDYILSSTTKPDEELIAKNKELIKTYFDELSLYREKKIELVATQTSLFGNPEMVSMDVNALKRREAQDHIKACEEIIKREENKRNLPEFERAVKEVTDWNPYDQNTPSEFFSPEWMFGVKDGFDIVVGNPPYVRQERLGMEYKTQLCGIYPDVGNGTADLYVYFFGLGLNMLVENGTLIYITLNKYLKTKYGKELRNTLAEKYNVDTIIDFFELPVFTASTDAAITKIINNVGNTETRYYPIKSLENLDLMKVVIGPYQETIKQESEWQFIKSEEASLLNKLSSDAILLGEFVHNRIYSGVKTGSNTAFVIDKSTRKRILDACENQVEYDKTNQVIKPAFRSRDIRKNNYSGPEQWLVFVPWHFPLPFEEADAIKDKKSVLVNAEKKLKSGYPALYKYLLSFKKELSDRNKEETGIRYEWYALQRWGAKYYKEFDEDKLIYIHTAKNHEFYFDQEAHFVNNSCYIIVSSSKFLFAFLNSSLFKYYKKIKFVAYGDGVEDGRCKLDSNKMVTVPIKKDVDEKPFEKIVAKVNGILAKNKNADVSAYEKQIDQMIYKLYGLTEDEIKIVEGKNCDDV